MAQIIEFPGRPAEVDPFANVPEFCGECGRETGTCDHVLCPVHKLWSRHNGGRLVGCPGICTGEVA